MWVRGKVVLLLLNVMLRVLVVSIGLVVAGLGCGLDISVFYVGLRVLGFCEIV